MATINLNLNVEGNTNPGSAIVFDLPGVPATLSGGMPDAPSGLARMEMDRVD